MNIQEAEEKTYTLFNKVKDPPSIKCPLETLYGQGVAYSIHLDDKMICVDFREEPPFRGSGKIFLSYAEHDEVKYEKEVKNYDIYTEDGGIRIDAISVDDEYLCPYISKISDYRNTRKAEIESFLVNGKNIVEERER